MMYLEVIGFIVYIIKINKKIIEKICDRKEFLFVYDLS